MTATISLRDAPAKVKDIDGPDLADLVQAIRKLTSELAAFREGQEVSRQDANGDTYWLAGTGYLR